MPVELTGADIAVLNALLKDGRKSFRRISRETKISTPTVKTRFNRLVNAGVIKSIIPIVDFDIVSYKVKDSNHKGIHVNQLDTSIKNATRQSINDSKKYIVTEYLIYDYKLDKFYPFVPINEQQKQRNHSEELKIMSALADEKLPFEKKMSRWYPIWNIPVKL